jgi:hypothetical protein
VQAPESNQLINFHFHVSPWGTQTDAPNAMVISTLSNSTKTTKAILGTIEEEQKEENTKFIQDLDLMDSLTRKEF